MKRSVARSIVGKSASASAFPIRLAAGRVDSFSSCRRRTHSDGIRSEQAALAFINPPPPIAEKDPTAQSGRLGTANASNSAVGIAIIQLAKAFGFKTLNSVRRPELIAPLTALGADQVVLEGSGWHQAAADYRRWLALNSIGGSSAIDQIKASQAGTHVTFGAMTVKRSASTRYLIFRAHPTTRLLVGLAAPSTWQRAVNSVMQTIFQYIRTASSKHLSHKHALEEYKAALAYAQAPRMGKCSLALSKTVLACVNDCWID